jgi:hypothetical protein
MMEMLVVGWGHIIKVKRYRHHILRRRKEISKSRLKKKTPQGSESE